MKFCVKKAEKVQKKLEKRLEKSLNYDISNQFWPAKSSGWMVGWGGWVEVKAILRFAYSSQQTKQQQISMEVCHLFLFLENKLYLVSSNPR